MTYNPQASFYIDVAHWTPVWIFLNTLGNGCLAAAIFFLAMKLCRVAMARETMPIRLSHRWLVHATIFYLMIGANSLIYVIAVVCPIVPLMAILKAVSGLYGLTLCLFYNVNSSGYGTNVIIVADTKARQRRS